MDKWQEKGPHANLRAEMPQTDCAQNKEQLRNNLALKFAPPLFNCFALPSKTICAAKEMVPARICRAPAKPIVIVRAHLFVAMTTATGVKGSTAARKNANPLAVVLPAAHVGKMRVSVQAAGIA